MVAANSRQCETALMGDNFYLLPLTINAPMVFSVQAHWKLFLMILYGGGGADNDDASPMRRHNV